MAGEVRNDDDVPHDEDRKFEVRNNTVRSRYELFVDGEFRGFTEYRDTGNAVIFPHTIIEAEHRGNGLGAVLVRGALDDVRRRGRGPVTAQCWYVAEFIDDNPEYRDLLAA
ncbi:MAG TPA: GNAT family N-acetyltransferase [Acidimicrobiales bacterium]